MATRETLEAVWDRLVQSFRQYMAAQYPTDQARALFLADLVDLPDADLVAAIQAEKHRPGLFPNDNLAGILRDAAKRIGEEHAKSAARAEGERKHQLALEEIKRERAALYLAGSTLDQKPDEMSFSAWLDQNAALLTSTDDPLEVAMRMVGGKHSMDERLRQSLMNCINLARDRRPPVDGYGPPKPAASWFDKDGQ